MSREFGSYTSGYFHKQIETAAEDCKAGNDELTRLWGAFLEEFYDIAYEIASSEAGDSGISYPIAETIKKMDALQKRLDDIKRYVEPYVRIAQDAVERALEEEVKKRAESAKRFVDEMERIHSRCRPHDDRPGMHHDPECESYVPF